MVHLVTTHGEGCYLRLIVKGKEISIWNSLKKKFNRLCAMYHGFFDLLKYIGFGWDAKTITMHALKETWQNYIKVKTTSKLIIF